MRDLPPTRYGRVAALAVGLLFAASAATAQDSEPRPPLPPAALSLDDAAVDTWLERLRPTEDELTFESVDWLPSFEAGILAADTQDKPLLMWVMNGHPLGCT